MAKRQVNDVSKRMGNEMEEKLKLKEEQVRKAARGEHEAQLQERLIDMEREREAAVASAYREAQLKEEALRSEWYKELSRALGEKERLENELRKRDDRPLAVLAMEKAQRQLEDALADSTKPDLFGIRTMIFGAPSLERLAQAVATAHAAGVSSAAIAPAEAALHQATAVEEANVTEQVEKLVATLGKLESAGTQAKIAHAGLASAGLVVADSEVMRAEAAAAGKTVVDAKLFKRFDANRDGVVSVAEFDASMQEQSRLFTKGAASAESAAARAEAAAKRASERASDAAARQYNDMRKYALPPPAAQQPTTKQQLPQPQSLASQQQQTTVLAMRDWEAVPSPTQFLSVASVAVAGAPLAAAIGAPSASSPAKAPKPQATSPLKLSKLGGGGAMGGGGVGSPKAVAASYHPTGAASYRGPVSSAKTPSAVSIPAAQSHRMPKAGGATKKKAGGTSSSSSPRGGSPKL